MLSRQTCAHVWKADKWNHTTTYILTLIHRNYICNRFKISIKGVQNREMKYTLKAVQVLAEFRDTSVFPFYAALHVSIQCCHPQRHSHPHRTTNSVLPPQPQQPLFQKIILNFIRLTFKKKRLFPLFIFCHTVNYIGFCTKRSQAEQTTSNLKLWEVMEDINQLMKYKQQRLISYNSHSGGPSWRL